MASTYSSDLTLEIITTGEKAGLWGTITNTNLEILQAAASGYVEVPMTSGTDVTLSQQMDRHLQMVKIFI